MCKKCCYKDFGPLSSHAGDFLTEFLKLCSRKESTEDVLGRGSAEDKGKGLATGCTGVDDIGLHARNHSYAHFKNESVRLSDLRGFVTFTNVFVFWVFS